MTVTSHTAQPRLRLHWYVTRLDDVFSSYCLKPTEKKMIPKKDQIFHVVLINVMILLEV